LLADFFGGSARRRAGSALTTGALFQCTVTLGLGALLFVGLQPFAFLVAGLTLVATLTVLVLGPEAALLFREDGPEAALPVKRSTIAAARALHGICYIVLGTACAAVPIAVLAGFALGGVIPGVLTFAAAIQQTLFFTLALAAADRLLGRAGAASKLRPLITFALSALLVATLLAGIRPLPELERLVADAGRGLLAFPPAWFAGEVLQLSGDAARTPAGLGDLGIVAIAATLTAAAAAFLLRSAPAAPAPPRPPGERRSLAPRWLVNDAERATFEFTLAHIARERDLAFRAGPIFAFPAALLFVGSAIGDPDERERFVHVLLFVASAYLPAAVLLLSRSRHAAGRWIFDTAPIASPEMLRRGTWKATLLAIGLPFFVALFATDAVVRGPAAALLHAPIVALVQAGVLWFAVRQLPDPFPMGQGLERLGGDAGEGILGLAFGLTILGFVEGYLITSFAASAGAALVGIVAFAWLLRPKGTPVAARR
jgi:hypothetical protein